VKFLNGCALAGVQSAVLRIVDSPGGFVDCAFSIRRALQRARALGVHVTAALEKRCHSAATLVALGCDYIVAQPGTTWCATTRRPP